MIQVGVVGEVDALRTLVRGGASRSQFSPAMVMRVSVAVGWDLDSGEVARGDLARHPWDLDLVGARGVGDTSATGHYQRDVGYLNEFVDEGSDGRSAALLRAGAGHGGRWSARWWWGEQRPDQQLLRVGQLIDVGLMGVFECAEVLSDNAPWSPAGTRPLGRSRHGPWPGTETPALRGDDELRLIGAHAERRRHGRLARARLADDDHGEVVPLRLTEDVTCFAL